MTRTAGKAALTLVTAPEVEPITLAEAKTHLRVDGSDDDDYITTLIEAARRHVDARDGWLGRALISQTWDLSLDAFPDGVSPIRLRLPPVQSVTSITYVDTAGASQTLSAADTDHGWMLNADTDWRPRIDLKYNMTWPATRCQPGAVTVRTVNGYASANSPADGSGVPSPIRHGMKLLIGHWYDQREAVNVGNSVNVMPMAVESLLTPYRVAWF